MGTGGRFSYSPLAGTGQSFYASCESTNCKSGRTITSNSINVNTIPSAPTINPPPELIVCSPSTLILTASECPGTITWSQGAATGTSLTLSIPGTYSVNATCTFNGCTSDPTPNITGLEIRSTLPPTATNSPTICSGTTASLWLPVLVAL